MIPRIAALSAVLLVSTSVLQSATKAPTDWPRVFKGDGNELQIFQPQIDNWSDGVLIQARFAVLVTLKGSLKPAAGIISVDARTETNHETRTVVIKDFEVSALKFGIEDDHYREEVMLATKKLFPNKKVTTSLDRLLSMMHPEEAPPQAVAVKNDPPIIHVRQTPARLLMFDGKPGFAPVQDATGFYYAVNTNWDLFRKGEASTYYLLNEGQWLTAPKMTGPWEAIHQLPPDFNNLPPNDNWNDVKAEIPPKSKGAITRVPEIIYSEGPSELILIDGEPQLKRISESQLSYVSNTQSDLFWHSESRQFYYLVAGRWFRAATLQGPWTFCTNDLPGDFAQIPPNHTKGLVLASVPGTPEAKEAVLQAQIPTLATVTRKDVVPPQVKYIGEPDFKPIEGTSAWYGANTSSTVLQVGSAYYLCEKGVWFNSADPKGPWALAEKVPDEIYSIPPSSPAHNATYVKVYESSDSAVTYGYTSGYMGGFVVGTTVVWGTGYYYPSYYYWGSMYPYPVYWYYPYTYGCGAYYNPYTGFYYQGAFGYGPYGGWGYGAAYNPNTGTYARRAAAYGPYGAATGFQAYNPRTGNYAAGYRAATPYQSWGQGVVTNGDDWVKGGYYGDSRGAAAGYRTSQGGAGLGVVTDDGRAGIVKTGSGDVYAGKDGNVYRKQDGQWQSYDNGSWSSVDKPQMSADQKQQLQQRGADAQASRASTTRQGGQVSSDTLNSLNRDYAGRQRSTQRSQSYSNWRSSGSSPRSYGGGMSRGGGGGRRR